jgi:hypothetical protein
MRQRAGRYIIPVSLRSVIFNAIIMSEPQRVTLLLAQWAKGSQKALNELTRYVYPKLRQLAASHLRKESVDHTFAADSAPGEGGARLFQKPTKASNSIP